MTDTLTDVARRTASNSMRLFKEAVTRIARAARAAALEMGREIGQAPAQTTAPAQITPAAPAPAQPAPSVVSAKAEIIGSITTTEELHVHGTVNGDISAARIIVGSGGAVKGGLTAQTVVVHGAVEGGIDAECVLLCANAVVAGDLTHRMLGIDTTAQFEGAVKRLPQPAAAALAAE